MTLQEIRELTRAAVGLEWRLPDDRTRSRLRWRLAEVLLLLAPELLELWRVVEEDECPSPLEEEEHTPCPCGTCSAVRKLRERASRIKPLKHHENEREVGDDW